MEEIIEKKWKGLERTGCMVDGKNGSTRRRKRGLWSTYIMFVDLSIS